MPKNGAAERAVSGGLAAGRGLAKGASLPLRLGAVSLCGMSSAQLERAAEEQAAAALGAPWVTIVWNDPVNLMNYVTYVFQTYFGYPREKAERLMRQVHHEGRSVVSTGPKEKMESDVQAMHSFGLWATLQRSGGV